MGYDNNNHIPPLAHQLSTRVVSMKHKIVPHELIKTLAIKSYNIWEWHWKDLTHYRQ